jgi:hypothetical protein
MVLSMLVSIVRRRFPLSRSMVLALALVSMAQVTSSSRASAYVSGGCRFSGNAVRTAKYQITSSVGSSWRSRIGTAASWWTNGNNDLKFQETTVTSERHFYFAQTSTGVTQWNSNGCPGGVNGSNSFIQISTSWSGDGTATLNTMDVSHELGHAGALGHVTNSMSCSDSWTYVGGLSIAPKSVMKSGATANDAQYWAYINCPGVPPFIDDRNGVHATYPGGS